MTRGRILAATSFAVLLTASLAPQSSHFFRDQLDTLLGNWTAPMGNGYIGRHRDLDEVSALAFANAATPDGILDPERAIQGLRKWADVRRDKEGWAALVRYASSGAYRSLLPSDVPISETEREDQAQRVRTLEYACRRGEQLDPQNGFFPLMRAVALWASDRREESITSLRRAAGCELFTDYRESERAWRIGALEAHFGRASEEMKLAVSSQLTGHQYSAMMMYGRAVGQGGTDHDRALLIKVARHLADHVETSWDFLIAHSIVLRALGKKPDDLPLRPGDKPDPKVVEAAQELALKVDDPSVVANAARVSELAARLLQTGYYDGELNKWLNIYQGATSARIAGSGLLLAFAMMLLACLASVGYAKAVGRSDSATTSAGSLPHLIAAGSWIYVSAVIPTESQSPGPLLVMSLIHVALACLYGSDRLARVTALAWCAVMVNLVLWERDLLFEPVLWASVVVIPLALRPAELRAKWSTIVGFAVAGVTFFLAMVAQEAIIPALAFAISWLIRRWKPLSSPIVSSALLLGSVLGVGYVAAWLAGYRESSWSTTGALGAISAVFLGLLLRPTERPGRAGVLLLFVSILYLGNMGRCIAADARASAAVDKERSEAKAARLDARANARS